jgi:hypothetical protein
MVFKKGKSGNPAGKPKGALNRAPRVAQELLDGEVEALTRKAVELAKGGNPVALRLCLERLLPVRREWPVTLMLPPLRGAQDLPRALSAVIQAVATGHLTPGEGQALSSILESYRKGLELTDLEARLGALEERVRNAKR